MAGTRETLLAFQRETLSRTADRVEEHALGTLFLTPSLDSVWSLNALVVDDAAPSLGLDDVERVLGEHFPTQRFASALFHDDATGERLAAEARERGWKTESEVAMELCRAPDRVADTAGVREASRDEVMALLSVWFADDHAAQGEEVLRQLDEYAEREWRARPPRALVTADAKATCKLWSDGTTAQVEDVYTAADARGQGHARALITKAVELAQEAHHDRIFIVADDEDTPKELYARLGFDPVVRGIRVIRERPAPGG
ncbi:MAG TPA: GNAT family N-acetyltransferase [Solirubrobacteraceae bacterium]